MSPTRRLAWSVWLLVLASGCGRLGYDRLSLDDRRPVTDAGPAPDGSRWPREGVLADGAVSVDAAARDADAGVGSTDAGLVALPVTQARTVTASPGEYGHGCTLADGVVWCWGWNLYAQLGHDLEPIREPRPTPVAGLPPAQSIHASRDSTCALVSGVPFCWGEYEDGALGRGPTPPCTLPCKDPVPAPVLDPSGTAPWSGVTALDAGGGISGYACAVAGGAAWCWGHNGLGQLGDGTRTQRSLPTAVNLSGVATDIATGYGHTCAVVEPGEVYCWGDPDYGAVGVESAELVLEPTRVAGIATAARIALGTLHSCALLSDGTVSCWGANADGQLGDGTRTSRSTPALVGGLPAPVTDLSAGGLHDHMPDGHTCAVAGGEVFCWGRNREGQLGDGTRIDRWGPVRVVGLPAPAEQVDAGGTFSCAALSDGATWCWGDNTEGQLGDGTTLAASTPVRVSLVPR